jgi:hypothetical protein
VATTAIFRTACSFDFVLLASDWSNCYDVKFMSKKRDRRLRAGRDDDFSSLRGEKRKAEGFREPKVPTNHHNITIQNAKNSITSAALSFLFFSRCSLFSHKTEVLLCNTSLSLSLYFT